MLLIKPLSLTILFTLQTLAYNNAHEQKRNVHSTFANLVNPSNLQDGNAELLPESVLTAPEDNERIEDVEGKDGNSNNKVIELVVELEKRSGNAENVVGHAAANLTTAFAAVLQVYKGVLAAEGMGVLLKHLSKTASTSASSSSIISSSSSSSSTQASSSIIPSTSTSISSSPTSSPSSTPSNSTPTSTSSPSSTPTTTSPSINMQFSLSATPSPTSTPVALPALLSSLMPDGAAIVDVPSIFPSFSVVAPPSIPNIIFSTLSIPNVVFPTATIPNIIFPSASIPNIVFPSNAAKAKNPSSAQLTLPAPPSSSCAKQYTNTDAGAVYGIGLNDFPMNPRPSTFVKKSGSKLTLDGQPYRIVGPNIYWLGLDENVGSSPAYPSQGRIREAMAITVAMGANTIRSHTLGVSVGNSLSVWPSNGNTNEAAFKIIDYAIYAAGKYGLRLIIPLTDNYQYYHGGKFNFIEWAGLSTSDPDAFYNSDSVIKIFKAYISVILNRVNTYTKIAYKDDPTILAWETGNELGAYFLSGGAPPASWTSNIAGYIKSIAPKQLISDGSDGLINSGGSLTTNAFQVSNVDLVTDHFYPAENWLLTTDNGFLLSQSKNYFVGELDWTGIFGGDSLSSFYSQLESMSGSGSMIWSVFGHDDSCCNYVSHNDGYSLEYPNGNSDDAQSMILLLIQHWARMQGLNPPSSLPAVACPQPEF